MRSTAWVSRWLKARVTSSSTSYVSVDATNLVLTVPVIPNGFVVGLSAAGVLGVQTATAIVGVALFDGTTLLQEQKVQPAVSGVAAQVAFGIQWVIVGDGLTHVFSLKYKTTAGADSVVMFNDSATHVPTLVAQLTQSNFI